MKRRTRHDPPINPGRHRAAWQHAFEVLEAYIVSAQRPRKESFLSRRKIQGLYFVCEMPNSEGGKTRFTFHLDPHLRVSSTDLPLKFPRKLPRDIRERQNLIRQAIAPWASLLDFRSFSLLTAALSFDPADH